MNRKTLVYFTICFIIIAALGSPMSVSAEEGRYEGVSYDMVGCVYVDLGNYSPGTYIISSSSLPDAASNMLDGLSFVCNIPILGDYIPGCEYVEWGEKFLSIMPSARFCVRLTDAETDELIWEGELTSGADDLYLGDDHASYKVEMKPTITGTTYFVYLAKK